LNGSAQATLLGAPIYEAADMAAAGVADNLAVAFGDFKAGYQIVDRIGIRVIRDVYTNKPFTMFYTTKRVGGGVKNFEAIKLLKVKA
jgi:HK97 family phage major capsid protein